MTNQVIPEAAVEAAMIAWLDRAKAPGSWSLEEEVRAALEAAAPHMLAELPAQVWDEAMTSAAEIAWEHDASASSAIATTPNPHKPTP